MKTFIRSIALFVWITSAVTAQTVLQPHVRQSGSEVTIGNSYLERTLSLTPNLRTVLLTNHLSGTEQHVDSTEFEFRLGTEYETRLILRPKDFEVKDLHKEETPQRAFLRITLGSRAGVTVNLNYEARANEFFLRKWIELSLPKPEGVYVRVVSVDHVDFGSDVTIVPYEMFTHLARDSSKGSYFFVLDNPYSIPSSSPKQGWIALVYPPCLPISSSGSYVSHTALLGAALRAGKFYQPAGDWLVHQDDGVSPYPKIRTSLDLGEIEQLQRLVRMESSSMGKQAISASTSGPPYFWIHDSLPYVNGQGSGLAQLKESMDLTARFGIGAHLLGPDMASVMHVPEAWSLMDKEMVPYAAQKNLKILFPFTAVGPSFWAAVGWVPGDPGRIFYNRRNEADNKIMAESIINFCRHRVDLLWPDSNYEKIDIAFDRDRGFPGELPLSPSLYQDYQGWLKIFGDIKEALPNLVIWPGHFGNMSAPLFNRLLNGLMFCEQPYLLEHYKRYLDRPPALSAMKGLNDMEWLDYSYLTKERFLEYSDFEGNIWLQDDYDRPSDVSMEDPSTLFRYLVLARLAMTPNLMFYMPQPLMMWDLTEKDAEFSRHWIDFVKANLSILSHVQALDETPTFGQVGLFSHVEGGSGFLFVVNPNLDTKEKQITISSQIGFPSESGRHFTFRELYPNNRRLAVANGATGALGDTLTVSIPGTTVAVVEVSEEKTPAFGVYGAEIQNEHPDGRSYAASVLGRPGERNTVVLAAPQGKTVEAVSVNGQPQSIASNLSAVRFDLEFPGVPNNYEWMDWSVRNVGLQDGLASEFSKGFSSASIRFPVPESDVATSLDPLAAFAGGLLWRRDETHETTQVVSLQATWSDHRATPSGPRKKLVAGKPEVPAPSGSLWLSRDFQLDNQASKYIFAVQLRRPELFSVRAWINGKEVRMRHFEAPVTNANGDNAIVKDPKQVNPFVPYARVEELLRRGNNTIVIWIGIGQPASPNVGS